MGGGPRCYSIWPIVRPLGQAQDSITRKVISSLTGMRFPVLLSGLYPPTGACRGERQEACPLQVRSTSPAMTVSFHGAPNLRD